MAAPDNTEIVSLLNRIVSAKDRSAEIARNLETAILTQYPEADDDPRFEELMSVLASYEPAGGDYLYNSDQLAEECARVLAAIAQEQPGTKANDLR
jgi:hypothetical protein